MHTDILLSDFFLVFKKKMLSNDVKNWQDEHFLPAFCCKSPFPSYILLFPAQ